MAATRVAVTTVRRHAPPGEPSSFLYVVHLGERSTVRRIALPESPHRADDPNPRGGTRGARGVGAFGNRLVVASADRLFVLDPSWQIVDEITHRWMGGLHGLLAERDAIWVTSTAADLVLKLDWNGELLDAWSWREDADLVNTLGVRSAPAFDESRDYRIPSAGIAANDVGHLNALTRSDGGLVVTFGQLVSSRFLRVERARSMLARSAAAVPLARRSVALARRVQDRRRRRNPVPAPAKEGSSFVVVALPATSDQLRGASGARVLLRVDDTRVPNHDVVIEDCRLMYNDSNAERLVVHDLASNTQVRAISVPGDPAFARGLSRIDDDTVLVGSQKPAAIHAIEPDRGHHAWTVELGGAAANETVFGVTVLPDDFGHR
jgi:hypothetical protein